MTLINEAPFDLFEFIDELVYLYHHLRLKLYPSITLKELKKLPKESGIYYATKNNEVIYVGKAKNLRRRLNYQHGLIKRLEARNRLKGLRFYYRKVSLYKLDYVEALEIERFNYPRENTQRPNPADYYNWAIRLNDLALLGFFILGWCLFGFLIGMVMSI